MSDALRRQRGFSLPETLLAMTLLVMVVTALGGYQRGLAMVLMIMIVTALSGYQRVLMNSFIIRNQYQQLWRHAWQQTQLYPFSSPVNWQVNRMQTTRAGCVSINVIISSPLGRQGQMTRLHCPNRQ